MSNRYRKELDMSARPGGAYRFFDEEGVEYSLPMLQERLVHLLARRHDGYQLATLLVELVDMDWILLALQNLEHEAETTVETLPNPIPIWKEQKE